MATTQMTSAAQRVATAGDETIFQIRSGYLTVADPSYENYGMQRGTNRPLGLWELPARPGRWRAVTGVARDDLYSNGVPDVYAWHAAYANQWPTLLQQNAEPLGSVLVDSGTLVILDSEAYAPAGVATGEYHDPWTFFGRVGAALQQPQQGGVSNDIVPIFNRRGVALQSLGGNGEYAVSGVYDNGQVVALRLHLETE